MSLKQIVLILLELFGINYICRTVNSKKAIILWYHGICDDDFKMLKGYDERHIPRALFRKQLSYLTKKGYHFATMSELTQLLIEHKPIRKIVVLTFDDGFRNIVENAYPLMKEFNAKGCLYLVSHLISGQNLLWTDLIETVVRSEKTGEFRFVYKGETVPYQLSGKESYEHAILDIKKKLRAISDMERKKHLSQFQSQEKILKDIPKEFLIASWTEIHTLDKNILEMGSHTRNHPNCVNLSSEKELEFELKGSKEDIENQVRYPVNNFCYPAGSYNSRVIDYVKKYGYQSATTIVPGFNDATTPLYELRRISIDENFWLFKAMISGSYFFMSRLWQQAKGAK